MFKQLTAWALLGSLAAPILADRIPVPDWFGDTVNYHVQQIVDQGYAERIDKDDLGHVHILRQDIPQKEYDSVEDFLDNTILWLYHTDEDQSRGLVKKGDPRSLLGDKMGMVVDPRTMFSLPTDQYARYGTVTSQHLGDILTHLDISNNTSWVWHEGEKCFLDYQLTLEATDDGRYEAAGQRYDVFFDCHPWMEAPTELPVELQAKNSYTSTP